MSSTRIKSSPRHTDILLVEDDPGDAELTTEALRDGKILNRLNQVTDEVEALAYLRRQGPYAKAARPDVVLLDLNMPRKDGREVLAEIKADPALRDIPIVVLTTSESDEEILQSSRFAGQLLRHQAGWLRRIQQSGQVDWRVLVFGGQAATSPARLISAGLDPRDLQRGVSRRPLRPNIEIPARDFSGRRRSAEIAPALSAVDLYGMVGVLDVECTGLLHLELPAR